MTSKKDISQNSNTFFSIWLKSVYI